MKGLAYGCILAVLVAGCTAPTSPSTTTAPSSIQPEVQAPQTFTILVGSTVGVGNQGTNASVQEPANNGGPVRVEGNATGILVEARLTCTSPTCDHYAQLALITQNTAKTHGTSASFDGDLRWAFVPDGGIEPGKWGLVIHPDSATTGMQGELRATVFYNQGMPENFTAF